MFTHFKWVKIIQIWQNGGELFSNRADLYRIMALPSLKGGTECDNNWVKNPMYSAPAVKELLVDLITVIGNAMCI